MTVYVFVGPTLRPADAAGELDAVYLPPAQQGDVYRVTVRRPTAIGIVDGRFHNVPAVWHKEILWALSQGVPVYGSASMGALRAAELAAFGMRGVGRIFEAYRDGVLEDDDEVAVGHADADGGFRATSEAMVNIRRTLDAARDAGVVGARTATRLTDLVKQVFYAQRGYPLLLRLGRQAGLPGAELEALAGWLPAHRVDQKCADATEMLRVVRHDLEAGVGERPTFTFQHTQFFERSRRSAGELVLDGAGGDPDGVTLEDLLDEVRLRPRLYARLRERALVRLLSIRETQRRTGTGELTEEELREVADAFRRDRRLLGPAETGAWLAANNLSLGQFSALLREERAVRWVDAEAARELDIFLRSQLRVDGCYPELAARVRAKRRYLIETGLDTDVAGSDDVGNGDLLRWYFERLGTEVPEDIDRHWRSLDFSDEISFVRVVRREYRFSTATSTTAPPDRTTEEDDEHE
jgi:hypothetical protein